MINGTKMKGHKFSISDILNMGKPVHEGKETHTEIIDKAKAKPSYEPPTPPQSPERETTKPNQKSGGLRDISNTIKRKRDPIRELLDSLCNQKTTKKTQLEPSAFSPLRKDDAFIPSPVSPRESQCVSGNSLYTPFLPGSMRQEVVSPQQGHVDYSYMHQLQQMHELHQLQQSQARQLLPLMTTQHGAQANWLMQQNNLYFQTGNNAPNHFMGTNASMPFWMAWMRQQSHDPLTSRQVAKEVRVPPPPRYQCDACKKSYSTFGGLSKHKQFHCASHVKKEFNCKYCDKSYGSLGALKMHIRTHTLPCKCKLCGKAFSRPWLLQGHIRTHTGEKPFKCAHCGRSFADRSNLRAHLQTHSDIKKYACKTCTKTFSRMSLLLKHQDGSCLGLRR